MERNFNRDNFRDLSLASIQIPQNLNVNRSKSVLFFESRSFAILGMIEKKLCRLPLLLIQGMGMTKNQSYYHLSQNFPVYLLHLTSRFYPKLHFQCLAA